jgi:hypothetical protein
MDESQPNTTTLSTMVWKRTVSATAAGILAIVALANL